MKDSDFRKGAEYWVVYGGTVWDAVGIERQDARTAQFNLSKDSTSFVAVVDLSDVYESAEMLATRCDFEAGSWDKQREKIEELIRNREEADRETLGRQQDDASDDFHAETLMDVT